MTFLNTNQVSKLPTFPTFTHQLILIIRITVTTTLVSLQIMFFVCAPRAAVTQVISFSKLAVCFSLALSRSLDFSRQTIRPPPSPPNNLKTFFFFSCSYSNLKVSQHRFFLSFIDDLLISSLHLFKFTRQRTVYICQAKSNLFSASRFPKEKSLFVIFFFFSDSHSLTFFFLHQFFPINHQKQFFSRSKFHNFYAKTRNKENIHV